MKKAFLCFHQHDSMQCGIACLQMVCQHYGKSYSLDTLSQFCHATTEGDVDDISQEDTHSLTK